MVTNKQRGGVSSIEFLVSFSVMVTVMTFATSMTLNISRVWRDIEHQRLAVSELSNQLEELVRLSGEDLNQRVSQIEPSEFCNQGLDEPRISAKISSDALGQRIDLELAWKRHPVEKKVRLSGWAIDEQEKSAERSTENAADEGEQP